MKNIVESRQGVAAEGDVRSVVILGATGSIGRSTAESFPEQKALSGSKPSRAGGIRRLWRARAQPRRKIRCSRDPRGYAELKDALAGSGIEPRPATRQSSRLLCVQPTL